MGKGLLLGLLTGSLVSVSGLSVASLMAPPLDAAGRSTEAVTAMGDAAPAEPEQNPPETVAEAAESAAPVAEPETMANAEPAEIAEPEPEPASIAEPEPETELAMVADPAGTQPEAPVVEAPAGSEFTRERPDEDPVLPAAEAAPESMAAPVVEAPAAETAPDLPEVTPAEVPEGQTAAPETIPSPETTAPDALAEVPAAEQTTPLPQLEVAAPELGQGAASDTALALAPEPEAAPAIPAAEVVEQPEPETAPAAEMAEALPAAEPEMAEEEVAEALPATEPEAAETEMAEAAPAEEPAVAPEEEAGVAEDSLPEVLAEAEAEAETDAGDGRTPSIIGVGAQPRIGSDTGPQPGFAGAAGVRINRLPSIGGDVAEEPAAEPVAEAEILPDSGDMPAIERYAVAVDNPDGLPLVGVVLTDPASGGVSAEELAAITQPVTVAIDPTRADAAERAAALRAAGLEIAILVPELPAGATASDMEVSYQVFTRALPDAVAIIGAPDAPFQSDRRAAQHVVALLGSDGRGLITYDRGLNPARQAAESKDVPNAVIYRQLDARGESRLTMRRYLDRAAFEAARTGQVLVVAQASAESVAALSDWVASGAKDTMVAPVSAMMIPAGQ